MPIPNAIENETFDHYRKQEEIKRKTLQERAEALIDAKELLLKHGYKIIDLENQILDRENLVDFKKRRSIDYNRVRKQGHSEKTHSIIS